MLRQHDQSQPPSTERAADPFTSLGVLFEAGTLVEGFLCPAVGIVHKSLKTPSQVDELADAANVIVATAAVLSRSTDEAVSRLAARCDAVYFDEAHHVPARTWREIGQAFADRQVVQFTATPFREDAQVIGGRVAYAYPLRLAQERGYFAPINYRSITDFGDVDRAVAVAALAQLRVDLAAGHDHILMARAQSVARASELVALYEELAADLRPLRLDSKLSQRAQTAAKEALLTRTTRIVVCVDMLGEGFDLGALKVAAIHDPHKSLAVTLQFIGRFARVGEQYGAASAFVPRSAADVDDRLRRLYGEDSDWNVLVRDLTETEVEQEQARSDFESGFGSRPPQIALRSLQPKMSTVVYRSPKLQWDPTRVYDLFPDEQLVTRPIAINAGNRVAWWVTQEASPVPWGDLSNLAESVHHLYVVHADVDHGLLYVHSSNKDSLHKDVAYAIGGDGVDLIRGDVVYRILSRIARRVPTNVGLLDAVSRNRRFSMHVGADVLEGFGPTAGQKSKTNIYAHGYADAARVSYGASRKGRVWTHRVAHSVLDWVQWARTVGETLIDETIEVESVMAGFIIPIAATSRPDLVPLGVEWPYALLATTSEARRVYLNRVAHPLLDLDLELTSWSDHGPIQFAVRSDDWEALYQLTFSDDGPVYTATGNEAHVVLKEGTEPLSTFMTRNGMTVFFEQEALLGPDGYLIRPTRLTPTFDLERIEVDPWQGINIRKESQGPQRDPTSVQHRVIERLMAEEDWDLVIDDDGKGEVADAVFLRRDNRTLHILLAHCKFSAGDNAGARLEDLYEVCGQAVKSHKAKGEVPLVLRKLIRREQLRQKRGATGFIVGTPNELLTFANEARLLDARVTVLIAQPGVSRASVSRPMAEVLASVESFLADTYSSSFRVLCSE
jgi:hypothetical protein